MKRGRVEQLVRVAVSGKVEANVVSTGDIFISRNLLGGVGEAVETVKKVATEHNWDNMRLGVGRPGL